MVAAASDGGAVRGLLSAIRAGSRGGCFGEVVRTWVGVGPWRLLLGHVVDQLSDVVELGLVYPPQYVHAPHDTDNNLASSNLHRMVADRFTQHHRRDVAATGGTRPSYPFRNSGDLRRAESGQRTPFSSRSFPPMTQNVDSSCQDADYSPRTDFGMTDD
jgi:hypothetical protein